MHLHLLFCILVLCASALGNTEIRHFRPIDDRQNSYCLQQLPATILKAPYASTDIVAIAALENTERDQLDKEHWYCLQNLDPGLSHELRVSYAATTPSSFNIDIFSVMEVRSHYNLTDEQPLYAEEASAGQTMYARVTASYAGVSHIPGMENVRIQYTFVLEKHVLGLPVQALWLIAVIVVVVVFGILVVTPRLLAVIDSVISEPTNVTKED